MIQVARLCLLLPVVAASGCVAVPGAGGGPERVFTADAVAVTYRDRSYTAVISPGPAGMTLTRSGAVPVVGASVRVTAANLGRDEGFAGKQAARIACEGQGGVFQSQAIGRHAAADTWVFDGACA